MTANLFDNQITRCNKAHFAYKAWIIFCLFLRVWTKLPRPPSQGSCIFPKWKSIKLPGYGPNMIFIAWLVCMRWINDRLPLLQRHVRLLEDLENSHRLYTIGRPVGKRFGPSRLNNVKDWWISFGSHVYRIGWNLGLPFEKKFPSGKRGLPFRRSVRLRNFFHLIDFFSCMSPFFPLFVVVN